MSDASRRVNQRRHPRRRVTWPVTVETASRCLQGETLDVSPQGAKVRLKAQLEVGTRVTLHVTPPEDPPIATEAIVWRVDKDGIAFFFLSTDAGSDDEAEVLDLTADALKGQDSAEKVCSVLDSPLGGHDGGETIASKTRRSSQVEETASLVSSSMEFLVRHAATKLLCKGPPRRVLCLSCLERAVKRALGIHTKGRVGRALRTLARVPGAGLTYKHAFFCDQCGRATACLAAK